MLRMILRTTAILLATSTSVFAGNQVWNVTEEGKAGVKSSQGTWSVTVDTSNNISGKAEMQMDNGNVVAYTINGSVKDSLYTVNLADRSDGKKGCVWSGHSPANAGTTSHGLIGEVHCTGSSDFIIRAGF